jgi:hypothetical protein
VTPQGEVTFVFEERPPITCEKYETFAEEAEAGDYLLCPWWGVILISSVKITDNVVQINDLKGRGHMYNVSTVISIAREDYAGA